MPLAFDISKWFSNFVITWIPVMFFVLMCVVVYLLWKTVKLMPRVKPMEITPGSASAVTWADVAGLDEAKEELQEIVDFLRDPDRFEALGARVPKGILFHGPPGTGKTLAAKAVANESGARFYAQSASAFVEMFAGLGAARIRKLFEEARKNAPSIVFIDELDAVGMARSGNSFNREQDQTLNQLLVELDGFGPRDQVVVMGASNRLQDLDPALLRPGRFDRQILIQPPDLKGRRAILDVHTRGKPLDEDVDLDAVARQTAGLTGADLQNICNEAAIAAGRNGRSTLTHQGLRLRARARRRRPAAAARRHRQGEAHPRLPRGRPCADVAPRRQRAREGDDHRARYRARLRPAPAGGRALPRDEGRAARLDGDGARRSRRGADRLRSRHERRCQRPREGDASRARHGLRVGHGRVRHLAHDARRQLRAFRGDEAAARHRAGAADRRGLRRGAASAREAPRVARPRRAARCSRRRRSTARSSPGSSSDVEPESRSSDSVGVVRALGADPTG